MGEYSVVGKSVVRPDARNKATGQARYAVDLSLPGMLYAKILRSPLAHARILNIDSSKAERLPGVKAVVTGGRAGPGEKELLPMRPSEGRVFATEKVRFIGDEVAAVAAIDEETAEEALELIKVNYEPLPAYFDAISAMADGAEGIHDSEGNLAGEFHISRGNPEEAFSEAECIFQDGYVTHMQHQAYLEPMGCLAQYDGTGKLTMWVASMDPSGVRLALAKALGLPESKVRVIQAYVGGAYGGKITMLPLYPISALLAEKTGKPVMIVNTREEEFTSTLPRISVSIELKTGWKKDGIFLCKQASIVADNGAYLDRGPRIVAQMMVAPDCLYRVRNLKADARVVYTNKSPVGAMRGFGGTHMLFALETHLDRVALEMGLGPMELRLKNATQAGDVTAHGWEIGSCGLSDCIKQTAQRAGWDGRRPTASFHASGKQENQRLRGWGMACVTYDTDARQAPGFGGSLAYVQILEDGRARVISGESDYGQGWNTVAGQIAAEVLALPYESVEVTTPDTDVTPYANGPWGLRVTVSGGNAVKLAAEDARGKLLFLAAELLEANPEDLETHDGSIRVKGSPERLIPVAQVARTALFRRGGSAIIGRGLDETPNTAPRHPVTLYGNTSRAYNFGAQVAEVEIDKETGMVKVLKFVSAHDLGRAIHPAASEGQVEGSIATGFGYALSEIMTWEQGLVMNPNFCDYRLPTAADVPNMDTILVEPIDPHTPFGAKSIGQPATMLPPPAIANAIYNALGIRPRRLPLSGDAVLSLLEAGRATSP